jgi:hypothetical protein
MMQNWTIFKYRIGEYSYEKSWLPIAASASGMYHAPWILCGHNMNISMNPAKHDIILKQNPFTC